MVAKISHGINLYSVLSYNQEKVDEGLGRVLATHLVIEPTDGAVDAAACMQDFERFMPSHITTRKPVIHVSLTPPRTISRPMSSLLRSDKSIWSGWVTAINPI